MNGYELKMLRFLVSQCRKCKGTGKVGQLQLYKQCPDCAELRDMLKSHPGPKRNYTDTR